MHGANGWRFQGRTRQREWRGDKADRRSLEYRRPAFLSVSNMEFHYRRNLPANQPSFSSNFPCTLQLDLVQLLLSARRATDVDRRTREKRETRSFLRESRDSSMNLIVENSSPDDFLSRLLIYSCLCIFQRHSRMSFKDVSPLTKHASARFQI